MSENILTEVPITKKYNTEVDRPIDAKTVSNPPVQTRLYKKVKRVPFSQITNFDNCWYCQEDTRFRLVYCKRCFFYVQNNFNNLEYNEV